MTETADTRAGFKPTEPKSTAATPRDASIDGLPAELKASILHSAPNIPALQTLVRSSPLYHKVYLDDRKVILSAVLLCDIGPQVLPDALAVHKASQIGFDGSGSRKDSVKSFISQYKAEQGSSSLATCDSLDIGTLESLSRLQSVVFKITSDFCKATLSIHPVTGERIQPHGDLSINEKRRIYRALYRFELFRALFTEPVGIEIPPESRRCFDAMDQSLLFLSVFKGWEVGRSRRWLACVTTSSDVIQRFSGRVPLKLINFVLTKIYMMAGASFISQDYRLPNHLYRILANTKHRISHVPRSPVLMPIAQRIFSCAKGFYS